MLAPLLPIVPSSTIGFSAEPSALQNAANPTPGITPFLTQFLQLFQQATLSQTGQSSTTFPQAGFPSDLADVIPPELLQLLSDQLASQSETAAPTQPAEESQNLKDLIEELLTHLGVPEEEEDKTPAQKLEELKQQQEQQPATPSQPIVPVPPNPDTANGNSVNGNSVNVIPSEQGIPSSVSYEGQSGTEQPVTQFPTPTPIETPVPTEQTASPLPPKQQVLPANHQNQGVHPANTDHLAAVPGESRSSDVPPQEEPQTKQPIPSELHQSATAGKTPLVKLPGDGTQTRPEIRSNPDQTVERQEPQPNSGGVSTPTTSDVSQHSIPQREQQAVEPPAIENTASTSLPEQAIPTEAVTASPTPVPQPDPSQESTEEALSQNPQVEASNVGLNSQPQETQLTPPVFAHPSLPVSRTATGETLPETAAVDGASPAVPAAVPLTSSVNSATGPVVTSPSQPNSTVAFVEESEPASPRNTDRIAALMKKAHEENRRLKIQLNPAELGQLEIEVATHQGKVHARLSAENASAQQTLLEKLAHLHESLAQHGLRVDHVEVNVPQGLAHGLEQGDTAYRHSRWNGPGGNGYFARQQNEQPGKEPPQQSQQAPRSRQSWSHALDIQV